MTIEIMYHGEIHKAVVKIIKSRRREIDFCRSCFKVIPKGAKTYIFLNISTKTRLHGETDECLNNYRRDKCS